MTDAEKAFADASAAYGRAVGLVRLQDARSRYLRDQWVKERDEHTTAFAHKYGLKLLSDRDEHLSPDWSTLTPMDGNTQQEADRDRQNTFQAMESAGRKLVAAKAEAAAREGQGDG